jgi:integrase
MSPRARGEHVRKTCSCGWRRWPKCSHPWYFSYKPRGGSRYRFSFDAEFGGHVDSKIDAEKKAVAVRADIDAGTFERSADRRAREQREAVERAEQARTNPTPRTVSLDQFVETYIERGVKARGKATWKDDRSLLATAQAHRTADGRRLGEWSLDSITEDELEAVHTAQRAVGRAVSTLNHLVQVLKASFRWAARKGYIARSPISDESSLKRGQGAKRDRRVPPAEETALLAAATTLSRDAAGLRLSGLIVAAIETGCRQAELLTLQWGDIDLTQATLFIRAVEEGARKTGRSRHVPISARLAAVLEMARTDSAGADYSVTAYVFGLAGKRVKSIDKGWESCVLRSHGHEPVWTSNGKLDKVSRETLRAINLHFHDLRHEAGSRWLEAGMPLHHIKEMLGHANISQTDTYLNAGRTVLQASMRRLDEARRGNPVAIEEPKENRPRGHEQPIDGSKDLLH